MGNTVHASRCPFQPSTLGQANENRIFNAQISRLFGGEQAIILLAKRKQLVHAGTWHVAIML
jgi:hypothetical protein